LEGPETAALTRLYRAWVFAAGLVLGFSLLVDAGTKTDSNAAFLSSQQVLQHLGRLSPQAAQYHHILTTFADAISVYKEHLSQEKRKSKPQLVERILSMDQTGGRIEVPESSQLSLPDCTMVVEPIALDGGVATTYLPDHLTPQSVPVDWPQVADEDLMLRILWDGCTMNFVNPSQQSYSNEPF
jgi:hypothetical protein